MIERLAPGIGETFGGYTIDSVLARGGMGMVYLATHERLARKAAVKVIAPALARDESFHERFLRESRLAASLDHPNVIPIYDAGEIDGVLYLAMRYVAGSSLHERIRERGRLSAEDTLRIAEQVGGALDAAHRAGLVHRDVKPANVLVAEPEEHVYLCDFGLAKQTSSGGVTQTGSFFGTVDYSAPEQIEGAPLDGRVDVYALGCVLFHCLAGEPPYVRKTEFAVLQAHLADPPPRLTDASSDLPTSVDEVLARAMAKDPDARYPTAGELATAMRGALAGRVPAESEATRAAEPIPLDPRATVTASAAGTGEQSMRVTPSIRRIRPRGRWLIAAALLAALLAGIAVAVVATRGAGGGSNSAGSADVRTFVDRVENVLEQSAAGRREIGIALSQGLNCSIPHREAARRIASVADNRQSILEQLGSLETPTQESADLVTLLQRSLQQSIEADRHYRDGFRESRVGCPVPSNPSFRLAARSDATATAAKERFVAAFDPLAERFGRRSWLAGEI